MASECLPSPPLLPIIVSLRLNCRNRVCLPAYLISVPPKPSENISNESSPALHASIPFSFAPRANSLSILTPMSPNIRAYSTCACHSSSFFLPCTKVPEGARTYPNYLHYSCSLPCRGHLSQDTDSASTSSPANIRSTRMRGYVSSECVIFLSLHFPSLHLPYLPPLPALHQCIEPSKDLTKRTSTLPCQFIPNPPRIVLESKNERVLSPLNQPQYTHPSKAA